VTIGVIRCFLVNVIQNVGCHERRLIDEFLASGMSVTGIDAIPAFMRMSERHAVSGFTFRRRRCGIPKLLLQLLLFW